MTSPMTFSLLRAAGRSNASYRASAQLASHARLFSTSQRNHVRAVFGEASNDQLRDILKEIQEKITLPAHLPPAQKNILKNPKGKTFIEQNPVIIEIEGLEHKYTSILKASDMPHSKLAFKNATTNMRTTEDWANLETLLAGFKKAGIILKPHHFGRMVRLAVGRGALYSVIDCARHVQDTGFHLDASEAGFLVLQGLADKARDGDPATATKWLDQVLDILQRPPHSDLSGVRDLRTSKLARGAMLSVRLADVKASESPSEAQMNALGDEVEIVRSLWSRTPEDSLELEIDEMLLNGLPRVPGTKKDGTAIIKKQAWHTMSPWNTVKLISENINVLETAPAVLGKPSEPFPEASKRLDEYLTQQLTASTEVDEHIRKTLPVLAKAYYEVLGRAPTWAEPLMEEQGETATTTTTDGAKVEET